MSSHRSSVWNRLIEECEESLANALWVAAIREVAAHKLFSRNDWQIDDKEKEGRIEDLLSCWLEDALRSVSTNLADKIGESDYFLNISEPWYEILGFAGQACGWPTSDIIYSLELAYPQLEGEIASEEVEDFYEEWVAHFLGRVLREAATVKR